jgi:hypothetical protein
MKNFQRISFVLTAATLLTLWIHASAVAGPLEDGRAAYDRGDYQTALRLWQPLADQGNAWVQTDIGIMYDEGYGVTQSNIRAYMWYSLAADAGDEDGGDLRRALEDEMTEEQIAEAKRLAEEWKHKNN